MGVDYSVRMHAPFSLGELRSGTEQCLAEIVPGVAERAVDLLTNLPIPLSARPDTPRATADDLARHIGGTTPLLDNTLVITRDYDAVVEVSELDIGYYDDPEGGRWITANATWYRTSASRLLSVAIAVTAARLTGAPVFDELSQLTGNRICDPEDIVARLRYEGPAVRRLRNSAPDALEQVGITNSYWRTSSEYD